MRNRLLNEFIAKMIIKTVPVSLCVCVSLSKFMILGHEEYSFFNIKKKNK